MPYVTVPKDLTKVKSKVLFNLTKRSSVSASVCSLASPCISQPRSRWEIPLPPCS